MKYEHMFFRYVSEQTDIQTQRLQYFAPSWAKSLIYKQLQSSQGDPKMGPMSLTAHTFKTPEPMCLIFDNFNAIILQQYYHYQHYFH